MKRALTLLSFLSLVLLAFTHSLLSEEKLKEAYYYIKLDKGKVRCVLCPRQCLIPSGKRGFCGVRKNIGGKLYTLVYGKPCAVHIDPIEKKPLFHFYPGSKAFSLATAGCNLRCKFCQNWQISQARPEETITYNLPPRRLIEEVKKSGCKVIAYTYTEPTIFYEYMLETAKLAHQNGIKNIIHSAGFINPEPLRRLCKYLDAANVDLKGFREEYYQKTCSGSLEAVLRSLKILKEEGVWLEVTNLIVPGLNDSPQEIREMCLWIKENLGVNTPVHFSRFYPAYKLRNLFPTPVKTLERAREIALSTGLKYVYIGNVPGHKGEITYCPRCGRVLIRRVGYTILENNIIYGRCKFCGEEIAGRWQE
ncbi:MAG: AmmeMemoRadiSam system radical SAM enzyme [Candidatus Omnitrophota bacterium]|nr:MAG: AmmeMemoRadiSam system radical SAM enzyme [Candidatus Omnitrophota bacterium]